MCILNFRIKIIKKVKICRSIFRFNEQREIKDGKLYFYLFVIYTEQCYEFQR